MLLIRRLAHCTAARDGKQIRVLAAAGDATSYVAASNLSRSACVLDPTTVGEGFGSADPQLDGHVVGLRSRRPLGELVGSGGEVRCDIGGRVVL